MTHIFDVFWPLITLAIGYYGGKLAKRQPNTYQPIMILLLALVIAAGTSAIVHAFDAHAEPASEKRNIRTPDDYVCELTFENTLGKSVCRKPGNFGDYYMIYIEINPDTDRVFVDRFYPTSYDDIMIIDRQNMTVNEFNIRYS